MISWTAEDGSSVHRVVTQRMHITTNRAAVLRDANVEMAALLLAKRVVQQARQMDAASDKREAERLRRAIGGPSLLPDIRPSESPVISTRFSHHFCANDQVDAPVI